MRDSQRRFLETGRQILGAILLEVSHESRLARSVIVLVSLMLDRGTETMGQIVTPGPVNPMSRLQLLTRSSK